MLIEIPDNELHKMFAQEVKIILGQLIKRMDVEYYIRDAIRDSWKDAIDKEVMNQIENLPDIKEKIGVEILKKIQDKIAAISIVDEVPR